MYWHDMNGWDWLWGTFMMGFWIVLIGVVVYAAVKLAQGDRPHKSRP
jgi:hypothetical protein